MERAKGRLIQGRVALPLGRRQCTQQPLVTHPTGPSSPDRRGDGSQAVSVAFSQFRRSSRTACEDTQRAGYYRVRGSILGIPSVAAWSAGSILPLSVLSRRQRVHGYARGAPAPRRYAPAVKLDHTRRMYRPHNLALELHKLCTVITTAVPVLRLKVLQPAIASSAMYAEEC